MSSFTIRVKRVYDAPDPADGRRILVDRLWPRGLSKEAARIDYWARDVAPSTELRRWYAHEVARWAEFRDRYRRELDANPDGVATLRKEMATRGTTTFLFSSKETERNNAHVLSEYMGG